MRGTWHAFRLLQGDAGRSVYYDVESQPLSSAAQNTIVKTRKIARAVVAARCSADYPAMAGDLPAGYVTIAAAGRLAGGDRMARGHNSRHRLIAWPVFNHRAAISRPRCLGSGMRHRSVRRPGHCVCALRRVVKRGGNSHRLDCARSAGARWGSGLGRLSWLRRLNRDLVVIAARRRVSVGVIRIVRIGIGRVTVVSGIPETDAESRPPASIPTAISSMPPAVPTITAVPAAVISAMPTPVSTVPTAAESSSVESVRVGAE